MLRQHPTHPHFHFSVVVASIWLVSAITGCHCSCRTTHTHAPRSTKLFYSEHKVIIRPAENGLAGRKIQFWAQGRLKAPQKRDGQSANWHSQITAGHWQSSTQQFTPHWSSTRPIDSLGLIDCLQAHQSSTGSSTFTGRSAVCRPAFWAIVFFIYGELQRKDGSTNQTARFSFLFFTQD